MASTFSRVVDAIKADFDAAWSGPACTFYVGRLARSQHKSPGSIVWVCTGGIVAPPDGAGPGYHPAETDEDDPPTVASNSFLTDELVVEVSIWGIDEDTADKMRRQVCRSAFLVLTAGAVTFQGWTYVTQEAEGAAHMNLGALQRLTMTIKVPILEVEEQDTVTVTDLPFTEHYVPDINGINDIED